MNDTKQKYVRVEPYNQIIIFNAMTDHSTFKNLNPVSAGFCYIDAGKVSCFGHSVTLGIDSNKGDSFHATKQLFGWEAAETLNNKDSNDKQKILDYFDKFKDQIKSPILVLDIKHTCNFLEIKNYSLIKGLKDLGLNLFLFEDGKLDIKTYEIKQLNYEI